MKIMLVQPGIPGVYEGKEPPIGISILAAVLENEGYAIRCFDLEKIPLKTFYSSIEEFKPGIIGFSATTSCVVTVANYVKRIRKTNPDIKIIIGGYGVSCDPNYVMSYGFDYGIIGEAEETLKELCKAIKNNRPVDMIKGLVWKKEGKIIINRPRELIQNLDKLPYPAYYYFNPKHYGKSLAVYTSRGCPYGCIYCCVKKVGGQGFRGKSAKRVVDEFEYLKKRYKKRIFNIVDDNFAFDKKRAYDICNEIIKRKLDIEWYCGQGIRADSVDYPLLKKMKEAGCQMIAIGIETVNPESMKALKRGITLERIEQAIKDAQKAGLIVKTFNLIGAPHETYQDITSAIEFNKKLGVEMPRFGVYCIFPGTELQEWARKNTRLNKSYNPYKWFNPGAYLAEKTIPYETDYFTFKEKNRAYRITTKEANKSLIKTYLDNRFGRFSRLLYPLCLNSIAESVFRNVYFKFLRGKVEVWDKPSKKPKKP